jgi:hypothetical protein
MTLEAICLVHYYAEHIRETLLENRDMIISVRIEPSECNHMFAADLDSIWLANYGKDAARRLVKFHTEVRDKNLVMAKKLTSKIIRAYGNGDTNKIRESISDWVNIFGLYQED